MILAMTTAGAAQAQQDRLDLVPKEENIVLKPELRLSAGVSFPLAGYAQIDSVPSLKGGARTGGFLDLVLTHRFRRAPLWGVQVAAGYMQHGFAAQQIKDSFGLRSFNGSPWSLGYVMPGVAFQGGLRFKFEVNLHAGLAFYNGWNASRGDMEQGKTNVYLRQQWKYPWRTAGGFRGGLLLGYRLSERVMLFVEGWTFYAWGSRIGTLLEERFATDNQGVPQEQPFQSATFRVLNRNRFFTMQASIGVKFRLYKYLTEPKLMDN